MATDLSTMFQYAPGMAGFFTGQQQGSQMQTEDSNRAELAQKIQELQIKNQFDQQNNPQLLDQQRLKNRGLEEGLPEITAKAQQEAVKARIAQNTEQTATTAGNAENEQKLTKAQYDQAIEKQKALFLGAQVVQNTPPPMRAQALEQHLQSYHIDTNNPQMQQWIARNANNPEGITAQAKQFSDMLVQLDPTANVALQGHQVALEGHKIAAKASNYSADQRKAGEIGAAQLHKEAAIDVANIKHGQQVKDLNAEESQLLHDAKGDPWKLYNGYKALAQKAAYADEKLKADHFAVAANEHLAAAQEWINRNPGAAGKIDPNGLGIQTLQPVTLAPAASPTGTPAAAPPPRAAASGPRPGGVHERIINGSKVTITQDK